MTVSCRIKLVFLFFIINIGSIGAQNIESLDDCIRYAKENSLMMKNSQIDNNIAKQDVYTAWKDFLPSINTYSSVGKHFGRSVDPKSNLYTSSSFDKSTFGMLVSIPVFDGFTRLNKLHLSKIKEEISSLNIELEEDKVVCDVIENFYHCCLKNKEAALATAQRKLSEQYHEQMIVYVKLGLRSKSDSLEMVSRLQSDLLKEKESSAFYLISLLELKEKLNPKETDSLKIDSISFSYEMPIFSEEELAVTNVFQMAQKYLPQFKIMELREKVSGKSLSIVRGSFFPSINAEFHLNTGYYGTINNDGKVISFQNQLKNNMSRFIGINVTFPISDVFTRASQLRKEKLKIRQLKNENELLRLELYNKIEKAIISLQTEVEELHQLKQQIVLTKQVLSENEAKWDEGLISVFELIEKRNLYFEAQVMYYQSMLQCDLKTRIVKYYCTGNF